MVIYSNILDVNDIPVIEKFCIEERLDLDNLDNVEDNKYIIAKINEEVVGFGRIKIHKHNTYELSSVCVKKEFRKLGIGLNMIKLLIENSNRPIYLITEDTNIGFYTKLGFSVSNKIPDDLKEKFTFCVDFFKEFFIVLMKKT